MRGISYGSCREVNQMKVLVPVDGSEASLRAVDYAMKMADSSLVLLNVQDVGIASELMFTDWNEIAEQAAAKVGVKLSRIFMKDTGLDIYGTGLIAKDDDVKKRPDFVRAYVEATLEGLRYARDNQEEALKILLKHKPELEPALTTLQLKNALTEVFLPFESAQVGLGYMKSDIVEKTVKVTNEYFDVARKVTSKEVFTNQFIRR